MNIEENMEKAQIIGQFMVNFKNHDYAGSKKLALMPDLANIISLEDWRVIKEKRIYLNIIFSPGVTSPIEINIESGSQLISIDYNQLSILPKEERIAIVLHEIGHALNPHLSGEEGEFAADDYAIKHGLGDQIKSSLENLIISNPIEFDKDITRKRINRIN